MKKFTISALGTAVLAAMAATASADMMSSGNSFVNDSKMNIHLRNFYKQMSEKEGSNSADKDKGWSQAIRANFESGYFANLIGVDLSMHYALKLTESRGDDKQGDTKLFRKGSDGKGHSYGKVFGSVKVNLMDQGMAKYGRMRMDTPLLNDEDDRSLPSTVEAFYAHYDVIPGFTVYTAVAKKHNERNQSSYDNYGYGTKKHSVKTLGAMYAIDGLTATLAYGEQKEFAEQFYAEAGYTFPIDDSMIMSVGAQYGKKTTVGQFKDDNAASATAESKTFKDDDIDWFGLRAGLDLGKLDLSVSYTDVEQTSTSTNLGLSTASQGWSLYGNSVSSDLDSTEFAGYNSAQIDDFYNAGERSFKYMAAYDFSDMVKGLRASALYVDGTVKQVGKDADTSEYNIRLDYAVPTLEGLTVTLRHARYESDEEGKANDEVEKDTRVVLTYDLAVF